MQCPVQTRRTLLLAALATSAGLAAEGMASAGIASAGIASAGMASRAVAAAEEQPGSDERPQKGDLLVHSEGEQEGKLIKLDNLKLGGPPLHAWPQDPRTSVVRSGSRLNEILIVKLDPAELDEDTRARAADGIVAYSAICAHAGCPVTDWVKGEGLDKDVFKCPCHNSEYDPREGARVVFGPAPRHLAALPLAVIDGALTVAAPFIGKVGGQQTG